MFTISLLIFSAAHNGSEIKNVSSGWLSKSGLHFSSWSLNCARDTCQKDRTALRTGHLGERESYLLEMGISIGFQQMSEEQSIAEKKRF